MKNFIPHGASARERDVLSCGQSIHVQLYSTYSKIENEGVIQQLILEEVMRHRNSGIAKKVKSLFETLKLMAYSDPFLIENLMDEIEGIFLFSMVSGRTASTVG